MSRITMNVVAEALFGSSVDAETDRVIAAMEELQDAAGALFNSGFVPPAWLPTRKNRMLRRATDIVDAVLDRVIAERRRALIDRGDLLSMLLMARDEDGAPMSARQVRDEAVTLFLSGFETTANALTWVWYHLAKNPDVATRLQHEVQIQSTRQIPDLEPLPYVSMVLKESLRLSGPIWAFNRSPIVPESLGDHIVTPNDVVIISPYLLHRKERIFPEPDRFDPERFAPDREAEIPRLAFLPFGAGQRACIGARLAMLQAGIVIATIASRFRLTLPPGYEAEPDVQLSIRPKGGLQMRIESNVADAVSSLSSTS
jgi:cytochrome P450